MEQILQFTLTNSVGTPASIIVCISGVKQAVNAYAVTGTTLDFGVGNPPPAGTNTLEVVYLGLKADPSPIQDQTLGIDAIMRTNAQTITENMSVASTVNAMSCWTNHNCRYKSSYSIRLLDGGIIWVH